jgi:hypothetical protein
MNCRSDREPCCRSSKNCEHIENLGGDISHPDLQNRRLIIGCFPWKFQGGEAAFARRRLRRRVAEGDLMSCEINPMQMSPS